LRDKLRRYADEAARLERLRVLIGLAPTIEMRERMIIALRYIDP
jgi:hypothetical protein